MEISAVITTHSSKVDVKHVPQDYNRPLRDRRIRIEVGDITLFITVGDVAELKRELDRAVASHRLVEGYYR